MQSPADCIYGSYVLKWSDFDEILQAYYQHNSLYPSREYIHFGQEFATHLGKRLRNHKEFILSESTSPGESI